jgi:hypothetical protein
LGQLEQANILQGYNADVSTAPLSRNAMQQASMARLLPISTGLSLFGQQQQNLGNAANLLSSNESVWSNDPRLVPQLPAPSAGAQYAGVPNYGGGGYPVRPVSNYYFNGNQNVPSVNRPASRASQGRSQAEIDYKNDTGYWPQEDPNFNVMLYESYGGRVGQRPYARQDVMNDYPPNLISAADLPIEGLER